MGLDMYIYRAKRVSEEDLKAINGMSRDDIDNKFPRALVVTNEDYDDYPSLYTELLPYMSPVNVKNTYIDLVKLKEAYGIPENAYISGEAHENSKISYFFTIPDATEGKRVTLTYEEMEEKFTFERTDEARIVFIKEVFYWRKAYDIQNKFYESHPVENCGYYKVSCDELAEIADKYDENLGCVVDDFVDDEDVAYFYHEWY